jgi:hypothetical protein
MIEPTKTYCSDCEREMSGQSRTGGGRKSFRIFLFVVLILAAAEAYYLKKPAKEELSTSTQRVEKAAKVETKAPIKTPSTPASDKVETIPANQNQAAAKPVQTTATEASTNSTVSVPQNSQNLQTPPASPSTQPAQNTAAGSGAQTIPSASAEPSSPVSAPSSEAGQSVVAPQPLKPAEPEAGKAESKIPSLAPPAEPVNPAILAQPAKAETVIWVYYQKKAESDRRVAEAFKKLGFVNAQAKGRWEGSYRDQNIFYRTEDKKPVQALASMTPAENFQMYNYKSERIAGRIKEQFKKNAALEYLVIVH